MRNKGTSYKYKCIFVFNEQTLQIKGELDRSLLTESVYFITLIRSSAVGPLNLSFYLLNYFPLLSPRVYISLFSIDSTVHYCNPPIGSPLA